MIALEPRLMFDGAGLVAGIDGATETDTSATANPAAETEANATANEAATQSSTESSDSATADEVDSTAAPATSNEDETTESAAGDTTADEPVTSETDSTATAGDDQLLTETTEEIAAETSEAAPEGDAAASTEAEELAELAELITEGEAEEVVADTTATDTTVTDTPTVTAEAEVVEETTVEESSDNEDKKNDKDNDDEAVAAEEEAVEEEVIDPVTVPVDGPTEIIFVDSAVQDIETLIEGIVASAEASMADTTEPDAVESVTGDSASAAPAAAAAPSTAEAVTPSTDTTASAANEAAEDSMADMVLPEGVELVILDSSQDGVEQITEVLAGYTGVAAVHIVSHSNNGKVKLGNTVLSNNNVDEYHDMLATWSDSLTEEADILIYGCNVAADAEGIALVDELAEVTGADVAASSDDTGTAEYGGDWTLEYTTGEVITEVTFEQSSMADYSHILTAYFVSDTSDTFTFGTGPSLRDAIYASNQVGGADTIFLYSDTYTLYRDDGFGGLGDDMAIWGDLDIRDDLAIVGLSGSPRDVTIDASGFDSLGGDRVFHVHEGANVWMSGITITGGDAELGGGILNEGNLYLGTTPFGDGNYYSSAGWGSGETAGGFEEGFDPLIDEAPVVVENNEANKGGGIYSTGTLELWNDTRVTDNYARADGGGIYASAGSGDHGVLVADGSRVSHNTAVENGGGIYNEGSTVTVRDFNAEGPEDASRVSANQTYYGHGGGIYNDGGTVDVLSGGKVNMNFAAGSGGGIYSVDAPETVNVMHGGSVNHNTALLDGGGIYNHGGIVNLHGGEVNENHAYRNGGGIYSGGPDAEVNLTYYSTVNHNAAGGTGVFQSGAFFDTSDGYLFGDAAFNFYDSTLTGSVDDGSVWFNFGSLDGSLGIWQPSPRGSLPFAILGGDGGGIYNDGGEVLITEGSEVNHNTAYATFLGEAYVSIKGGYFSAEAHSVDEGEGGEEGAPPETSAIINGVTGTLSFDGEGFLYDPFHVLRSYFGSGVNTDDLPGGRGGGIFNNGGNVVIESTVVEDEETGDILSISQGGHVDYNVAGGPPPVPEMIWQSGVFAGNVHQLSLYDDGEPIYVQEARFNAEGSIHLNANFYGYGLAGQGGGIYNAGGNVSVSGASGFVAEGGSFSAEGGMVTEQSSVDGNVARREFQGEGHFSAEGYFNAEGRFISEGALFSGEGMLEDGTDNDTLATAQHVDGSLFNTFSDPNIADSETMRHVSITGHTNGDGFDYFSFDAEAGERGIFDIDFGSYYGEPGSMNAQLFLFDPDGNLVASFDDANTSFGEAGSTSGLDSYFEFLFQTSGTYTIGVGEFYSNAEDGGIIPERSNEIDEGDTYTLQISLGNNELSGSFDLHLNTYDFWFTTWDEACADHYRGGGTGGGIYNDAGIVTISNSTVDGNVAESGRGGGIFNTSGDFYGPVALSNTLYVTDSSVSHNTATFGGGIYNQRDTVYIERSDVSWNYAYRAGGGIYNEALFEGEGMPRLIGFYGEGAIPVAEVYISDNSHIDHNAAGGHASLIYSGSEGAIEFGGRGSATFERGERDPYDYGYKVRPGSGEFDAHVGFHFGLRPPDDALDIVATVGEGGGIYNAGGLVDITDSTVNYNVAYAGLRGAVSQILGQGDAGINGDFFTKGPFKKAGDARLDFYGSFYPDESDGVNIRELGAAAGGGIFNNHFGTINLTNSEVNHNQAGAIGLHLCLEGDFYSEGDISGGPRPLEFGDWTMAGDVHALGHFSGSATGGNGGGIYNHGGTVNIDNSMVNHNVAHAGFFGEGVFAGGGTLEAESEAQNNDKRITGRSTEFYVESSLHAEFWSDWFAPTSGSLFFDGEGYFGPYGFQQTSVGDGGGIYNYANHDDYAVVNISNGSQVNGNWAQGNGGGIYNNDISFSEGGMQKAFAVEGPVYDYATGAEVYISDSQVNENSAGGAGLVGGLGFDLGGLAGDIGFGLGGNPGDDLWFIGQGSVTGNSAETFGEGPGRKLSLLSVDTEGVGAFAGTVDLTVWGGNGGGIFNNYGVVELHDSHVDDNTAFGSFQGEGFVLGTLDATGENGGVDFWLRTMEPLRELPRIVGWDTRIDYGAGDLGAGFDPGAVPPFVYESAMDHFYGSGNGGGIYNKGMEAEYFVEGPVPYGYPMEGPILGSVLIDNTTVNGNQAGALGGWLAGGGDGGIKDFDILDPGESRIPDGILARGFMSASADVGLGLGAFIGFSTGGNGGGVYNEGGVVDIVDGSEVDGNIAHGAVAGVGVFSFYGHADNANARVLVDRAGGFDGLDVDLRNEQPGVFGVEMHLEGAKFIAGAPINYGPFDYRTVSSGDGGGIYNYYGDLYISESQVNDNWAQRNGGGIYNEGYLAPMIYDGPLPGYISEGPVSGYMTEGPGLYIDGHVILDDSQVNDNRAGGVGFIGGSDIPEAIGSLFGVDSIFGIPLPDLIGIGVGTIDSGFAGDYTVGFTVEDGIAGFLGAFETTIFGGNGGGIYNAGGQVEVLNGSHVDDNTAFGSFHGEGILVGAAHYDLQAEVAVFGDVFFGEGNNPIGDVLAGIGVGWFGDTLLDAIDLPFPVYGIDYPSDGPLPTIAAYTHFYNSGNGGGIYNGYGGGERGIFAIPGQVIVDDSTVNGNQAGARGGWLCGGGLGAHVSAAFSDIEGEFWAAGSFRADAVATEVQDGHHGYGVFWGTAMGGNGGGIYNGFGGNIATAAAVPDGGPLPYPVFNPGPYVEIRNGSEVNGNVAYEAMAGVGMFSFYGEASAGGVLLAENELFELPIIDDAPLMLGIGGFSANVHIDNMQFIVGTVPEHGPFYEGNNQINGVGGIHSGNGGGIYNAFGEVLISDSQVNHNWAQHNGGGIYNAGSISITNGMYPLQAGAALDTMPMPFSMVRGQVTVTDGSEVNYNQAGGVGFALDEYFGEGGLYDITHALFEPDFYFGGFGLFSTEAPAGEFPQPDFASVAAFNATGTFYGGGHFAAGVLGGNGGGIYNDGGQVRVLEDSHVDHNVAVGSFYGQGWFLGDENDSETEYTSGDDYEMPLHGLYGTFDLFGVGLFDGPGHVTGAPFGGDGVGGWLGSEALVEYTVGDINFERLFDAGNGGGIYNAPMGHGILNGQTNVAGAPVVYPGPLLLPAAGRVEVIDSTVAGNQAGVAAGLLYGGGWFATDYAGIDAEGSGVGVFRVDAEFTGGAYFEAGFYGGSGGGIYNGGELVVENSLIDGNFAQVGAYAYGHLGFYGTADGLGVLALGDLPHIGAPPGGLFAGGLFATRIGLSDFHAIDTWVQDPVHGFDGNGDHGVGGGFGGGIFNDGYAEVLLSTISNNEAEYGGGVANVGMMGHDYLPPVCFQIGPGYLPMPMPHGWLSMDSTSVEDNAAHVGGGILNDFGGTADIISSAIINNDAAFGGGISNGALANEWAVPEDAVFQTGQLVPSTLYLSNSTVSGNTADFEPMIDMKGEGYLTVVPDMMTEPYVDHWFTPYYYGAGGGIFNSFGTGQLLNNTVAFNSTNGHGGGIFDDGSVTKTSSLGLPEGSGTGFLDEMEDNNSIAGAQFIDPAEFVTFYNSYIGDSAFVPHVSIDANGDGTHDYFSFYVPFAGMTGSFDIDFGGNVGGDMDTELFLFDSAGNLLASNDDNFGDPGSTATSPIGENGDSFIAHTFANPGLYVIGVGEFNSSAVSGQIVGQAPDSGAADDGDLFFLWDEDIGSGLDDTYTLHISLAPSVTPGVPALSLANTIVAANTAGEGDPADTGPDVYGAFDSVGHNLIGDGRASSGFVNGVNGDKVGGVDGPVINPGLAPLADNGGPTLSHALLPGSPAIDMGSNLLATFFGDSPLLNEQRGSPLPYDVRGEGFARIVNGTIDIGSFESPGFPPPPVVLTPVVPTPGVAPAPAPIVIVPEVPAEPVRLVPPIFGPQFGTPEGEIGAEWSPNPRLILYDLFDTRIGHRPVVVLPGQAGYEAALPAPTEEVEELEEDPCVGLEGAALAECRAQQAAAEAEQAGEQPPAEAVPETVVPKTEGEAVPEPTDEVPQASFGTSGFSRQLLGADSFELERDALLVAAGLAVAESGANATRPRRLH